MSQFNFGDRLVQLEHKVDVVNRDHADKLNQLVQAIVNLAETHKLFTQYVSMRIEELANGEGNKSDTETGTAQSGNNEATDATDPGLIG